MQGIVHFRFRVSSLVRATLKPRRKIAGKKQKGTLNCRKKRNRWIVVCVKMLVTGAQETIRKACLKLFIDGFVIIACILSHLFSFRNNRPIAQPSRANGDGKLPERNDIGAWPNVEIG